MNRDRDIFYDSAEYYYESDPYATDSKKKYKKQEEVSVEEIQEELDDRRDETS